MSRSKRSNVSGGGIPVRGLFNREMGPLQRQLQHGEYSLLRLAPMLESEFLQINKRGDITDVHNELQTVTVGVACTSPNFPGPNVLLLARPVLTPEERPQKLTSFHRRRAPAKKLELTRLLPLSFVKISVHNAEKQQLRFKLASGRTFYLQLCPQLGVHEDVFELWVKVINMVRPPSASRVEFQGRTKDPGLPGKLPSQKTKSLSPAESSNLDETESIPSVYTPELVTPKQEDARSRRSMALSMGGPPKFHPPTRSPAAVEEKTSDLEIYNLSEGIESTESLQSPLRPQSKDREKKHSPTSNRKTNRSKRSRRRRSSQKGTTRKPSKIVSLIMSCSWANRRKSKSRDTKTRGKGKKR